MKKTFCLIMSLVLLLTFTSCGKKETKPENAAVPSVTEETQPQASMAVTPAEETQAGASMAAASPEEAAVTAPVTEYTQYGSVYMGMSVEDFNAAGFSLGDSCEVRFSNGYTLEDVPYYNGYNGRGGTPVICVYPGYERPVIGFCQGPELWEEAGLEEGDSVTVTLKEKGRYRNIQDTLNITYSNERSDFESDEVFANFRPLSGGDLKKDMFYRGASPVDNTMSRAEIVDNILWAYGIRFILNLADKEEKIASYREKDAFSSDYFVSLYEDNRVSLLNLTVSFRSEKFMTSLAGGLRDMMASEGPVYIHCLEGKDRTGFVCALLEALAGASYEEILEDYMRTYDNYYGITEEGEPEKYEAVRYIKFMDIIIQLTELPDDSDFGGTVLMDGAKQYLKECGMTDDEILALREYLCGE